MPRGREPDIADLLRSYVEKRKGEPYETVRATPWIGQVCTRAGLAIQELKRLCDRDHLNPTVGTLLKLSESLRLDVDERKALEQARGFTPGALAHTTAEVLQEEHISMRRGLLLLTAPKDPSALPSKLKKKSRYAEVATRDGVVFGPYDVVVRVTTPVGLSILDYGDALFEDKNIQLRTVETLPFRDDLPMYVDRTFSNAHLRKKTYIWAVIFVEALSGVRKPEFAEIFHEVAEREKFWGGIHLLTAGVTVGQFDSAIEVFAVKLEILKDYVREAQDHAKTKNRAAHTITYYSDRVKLQESPTGF